jgi:glycogen synthase
VTQNPPLPEQVLMTADAAGGVWTYACDLSRGLADQGVEVTLAVMGPPPDSLQRGSIQNVAGVTMLERPFRLEWMDEPWADVDAAGKWLIELERLIKPDVVHLNGYVHAALGWHAPTVVVAHSCVVSWWRAVHGVDPPEQWSEYRRRVAAGLRGADLVVAPTNAMLRELQECYGTLPRTMVIANGRYPRHLRTDGSSAARTIEPSNRTILSSVPRTPKRPFVLTAGRLWDRAKNIEAVCEAAAALEWPVHVAGDAVHPDGSTVSCAHVVFRGRLSVDAVRAEMEQASIYALPARYEPFGLSALEAGLAGCALVLGDIESLREVWGDAALFVPPEDTRALSAALNGLIRDAELRRELGERARRRAAAFTPLRMVQQYCDAYRSVLSFAAV